MVMLQAGCEDRVSANLLLPPFSETHLEQHSKQQQHLLSLKGPILPVGLWPFKTLKYRTFPRVLPCSAKLAMEAASSFAATSSFACSELELQDLSRSSSSVPFESDRRKSFACEGKTVGKKGRLSSPRAARELSLCVLYGALVSGQKPMWVFQERMKPSQVSTEDFNTDLLANYSYGLCDEDSIFVEDIESGRKLEEQQLEEALLEAEVLAAPLPLVYNKFVLKMAKDIIQCTSKAWSKQEIILECLVPSTWKEGEGAAIQKCILHMAMAEITHLQTPSKIVINEAVELTKRFCDRCAARVVNGCLGKFLQNLDVEEVIREEEEA